MHLVLVFIECFWDEGTKGSLILCEKTSYNTKISLTILSILTRIAPGVSNDHISPLFWSLPVLCKVPGTVSIPVGLGLITQKQVGAISPRSLAEGA